MPAHIKKRMLHHSRHMPRKVAKQLEGIYSQTVKNIKKHPYTATSSVLVSVGLASACYFFIRYFKK